MNVRDLKERFFKTALLFLEQEEKKPLISVEEREIYKDAYPKVKRALAPIQDIFYVQNNEKVFPVKILKNAIEHVIDSGIDPEQIDIARKARGTLVSIRHSLNYEYQSGSFLDDETIASLVLAISTIDQELLCNLKGCKTRTNNGFVQLNHEK